MERAYHLSKAWQLVDDTQVVTLAPLRLKATSTGTHPCSSMIYLIISHINC